MRATLVLALLRSPPQVPMEPERLLEEASKGGFFSYACGVAYQIQTRYHVRGVDIDNYATTLPACKGLSSSAAICVLVARAFNRKAACSLCAAGDEPCRSA